MNWKKQPSSTEPTILPFFTRSSCLSKPALATVGLFYAVNRWNSYFWAMQLLTDDKKAPLQVMLKKMIVDRVANASDAALGHGRIFKFTNHHHLCSDHPCDHSNVSRIPVCPEIFQNRTYGRRSKGLK